VDLFLAVEKLYDLDSIAGLYLQLIKQKSKLMFRRIKKLLYSFLAKFMHGAL